MFIICALEQENLYHKNKIKLDENLIVKTGDGDLGAFKEIYILTSSAVMGFALSIVKNRHDAEDIMQDTYIKIRNYAKNYKKQGKPMAWIFTIVKNLALAKLKHASSQNLNLDEQFDLADETNHYEAVENSLLLKALMSELSEIERNVLVLHAQTGLKHREIAQILDIPLATVLSKYSRAISKMQKKIGKENKYE